MESPPLVLVTGGNGFVGYAVLLGILKSGVRLSLLRSKSMLDQQLGTWPC